MKMNDEKMNALKVKNIASDFVNFCMALDIRFAYSDNTFFVFGTSKPDKFRNYCKAKGFSQWESMEITACDFESEFDLEL